MSPPSSTATQSLVSFTFTTANACASLACLLLSFRLFISAFSFFTAFIGSALFSSVFSSSISLRQAFARFSAALEHTASILRTPALTPPSFVMKNAPIWLKFATCVPPQSSLLTSPKLSTRTLSAYFSPKRAIAPLFLASSMSIISVLASIFLLIAALTKFSIFVSSSAVTAFGCEKSNLSLLASTLDPACAICVPSTLLSAAWSRCVAL